MMDKTPTEIAGAYSEALESQADDGEYEAVQRRLDGLRERLEKFEDTYDDSDPATQELREKVQSAEEEAEELELERQEPEELERELLETVTRFTLDDEWLQSEVIEALNQALIGSPHPTLRVDDIELAEPDDVEDLDELARYDIIDVIRKLALDKLGETDDLKQVWRSIEGTTREAPFRVVAETDNANPDDVVEAMDEDIERSVAGNRLKNAVYQLEISPYHREDGTYSLSTAGCYIAAEYADAENTDERETADGDSGDDGQTTLVGEATPVDGGEGDE